MLTSGCILQVLNDFVAVGYAIPTLVESDVVTINRGERVEGGPVAVMGPGTGLGECQLMWDSGLLPDSKICSAVCPVLMHSRCCIAIHPSCGWKNAR